MFDPVITGVGGIAPMSLDMAGERLPMSVSAAEETAERQELHPDLSQFDRSLGAEVSTTPQVNPNLATFAEALAEAKSRLEDRRLQTGRALPSTRQETDVYIDELHAEASRLFLIAAAETSNHMFDPNNPVKHLQEGPNVLPGMSRTVASTLPRPTYRYRDSVSSNPRT